MHQLLTASCVIALTTLAACGGGGGSPAKPTPTAVGITITPGDDFLLVGQTVQLSAKVNLSDGTSSLQQGTWGSDTPNVATVDSTGKVTAHSHGKVTVYVDIQGQRGTRLITVNVNFAGEWHGTWAIDKCTATGEFKSIDFCDTVKAGDTDAMTLTLTQDHNSVTGILEFPTCPCSGDVTGTVSDDGVMTLDGTIPLQGFILALKNWATRSSTPGKLTGKFTLNWTYPGASGAGNWDAHFTTMARTAGGPSSAEADGIVPPVEGNLFQRLRVPGGGSR